MPRVCSAPCLDRQARASVLSEHCATEPANFWQRFPVRAVPPAMPNIVRSLRWPARHGTHWNDYGCRTHGFPRWLPEAHCFAQVLYSASPKSWAEAMGPHALECPRDLLVWVELGRWPGRLVRRCARLLRRLLGVAVGLLVASPRPSVRPIHRRLCPCSLSVCSITRSSGCNCWNVLFIFTPPSWARCCISDLRPPVHPKPGIKDRRCEKCTTPLFQASGS